MSFVQEKKFASAMDRVATELDGLANDLRLSEEAIHLILNKLEWTEVGKHAEEIQSIDRIIQTLEALSKYMHAIGRASEVGEDSARAETVIHLEALRDRLSGKLNPYRAIEGTEAGHIDLF